MFMKLCVKFREVLWDMLVIVLDAACMENMRHKNI